MKLLRPSVIITCLVMLLGVNMNAAEPDSEGQTGGGNVEQVGTAYWVY